jgi:hypothetical protein
MDTEQQLDVLFRAFCVTNSKLLIAELADHLMLQGTLWGYVIDNNEVTPDEFTTHVNGLKERASKTPFLQALWYSGRCFSHAFSRV